MTRLSTLFLATGYSQLHCKLHPVVLFNILDHFIRRDASQERVIGTLLGVNNEGVIEVRNSFPVPHHESDQVGVFSDFLASMMQLHSKANPKEVIVGWYSTGSELTENTVYINDFYWKESGQMPIHLTVDTNLLGTGMGIKAHVISPISLHLPEKTGSHFQPLNQPVKLDIETIEAEKTAVEVLMRSKSEGSGQKTLHSELENVENAVENIQKMIDTISEYVDKVISGAIVPDANIGRFLLNSISKLPKLDPQLFEKMFNNSLQDLLMVVYLANLTRTQLAFAEKMQTLP